MMQVPRAMWENTGVERGGRGQPYKSVFNLASYKPPCIVAPAMETKHLTNDSPKVYSASFHIISSYQRSLCKIVPCTLRNNSEANDYASLTLMGRILQSTKLSESWDGGGAAVVQRKEIPLTLAGDKMAIK